MASLNSNIIQKGNTRQISLYKAEIFLIAADVSNTTITEMQIAWIVSKKLIVDTTTTCVPSPQTLSSSNLTGSQYFHYIEQHKINLSPIANV